MKKRHYPHGERRTTIVEIAVAGFFVRALSKYWIHTTLYRIAVRTTDA